MRGDEVGSTHSCSEIGIGLTQNGRFFVVGGGGPNRMRGDGGEGQLLIPRSMLADAMGGYLPDLEAVLRILEVSPLGRMLRIQAMVIAAGMQATPIDGGNVVLQSMVELIQIILKQALPEDAVSIGTRQSLTERAYQFIEQNLSNPKLNAQTIAEGIGCSRATLYRLFSQRDTSVAKVVREARLKRVRELLASTPSEISTKHIALEVGFVDLSNFARFVRRHFGMPPTLLRPAPGREAALKIHRPHFWPTGREIPHASAG